MEITDNTRESNNSSGSSLNGSGDTKCTGTRITGIKLRKAHEFEVRKWTAVASVGLKKPTILKYLPYVNT